MKINAELNSTNAKDLLAERGLDISYETVRRWCLKFSEPIARNLRSSRPTPNDIWHLDEIVFVIQGKRHFLWRAVDSEGEVLDFLAQSRRNAKAALKLIRKLLKKQGFAPSQIVTDKLKSHQKAFRDLGLTAAHTGNKRSNNRPENSHQPFRRREHAMIKFRSAKTLQKFTSIHSSILNHFNHERRLKSRQIFKTNRDAALTEWRQLAI